jgi:hypothetical protein
MLKSEVAQLKSLLLAHKDCPVTVAQQKMTVQNQMGPGKNQNVYKIQNLSKLPFGKNWTERVVIVLVERISTMTCYDRPACPVIFHTCTIFAADQISCR